MDFNVQNFVKKVLIPSKCVVCDNIILGGCYVDTYGNKVCMHHKDKATYCLSCGRLSSKEKSKHIGQDQYICEICSSHCPPDKSIPSITEYVRKVLTEHGIDGIPTFTLHRVELSELQRRTGRFCEGCASYNGSTSDIYILKYLSRTCYASVLAHEMLHLWQFKNRISPRQDICEGFCNLGSYEVLKSIGTEVALSRISNLEKDPDPIYGDGFRKVKSVYDTGGWEKVIDKIKRTKK